MVNLAEAYEACERAAAAHYENFPVASMLVPRAMRRDIAAVYAFARAADDFADEGMWTTDERLRLLDGWLRRLEECAASESPGLPPAPGEPPHSVDIFVALGATIRTRALPLSLFEDLLSAFRQDVTVSRYQTWDELLDYCRRSANPIGRLVLRIAGYRDDMLDTQSDAICTALQLTNVWQDVKIDFERGRVYLPQEIMRLHGAAEADLGEPSLAPPLTQAMAAAVDRTRTLFAAGRPLCDAVDGRLRHQLRATWLGGVRILDRLETTHFDPLAHRPRLRLADAPWFAWRLATWSGKGEGAYAR